MFGKEFCRTVVQKCSPSKIGGSTGKDQLQSDLKHNNKRINMFKSLSRFSERIPKEEKEEDEKEDKERIRKEIFAFINGYELNNKNI